MGVVCDCDVLNVYDCMFCECKLCVNVQNKISMIFCCCVFPKQKIQYQTSNRNIEQKHRRFYYVNTTDNFDNAPKNKITSLLNHLENVLKPSCYA